ncbi:MAG: RNA methyltransferase [Bacteroidales bacterium]|nr:RNA methyltransferase [Bacteroidales bacterium]
MLFADNKLPTANCELRTANCELPTANCELPTANYMISASRIKFVRSLHQKKFRDLHRCFIAEGSKLVLEFAESTFRIQQIFCNEEWSQNHSISERIPVEIIKPSEMSRITVLSSASPVLAVVEMPENSDDLKSRAWDGDFTLVLDGIKDPGNMGTIIRIADWFGIGQVICSMDCVDQFNPKVVQSTMGSMIRVGVHSVDLPEFLSALKGQVPVYGMVLDGENFSSDAANAKGLIVIGSEAHGISEEVVPFITHKRTIPCYPAGRGNHAESLNAAVATGIICAEFRK